MSRQKFIVDVASTFQLYVYEDGQKIVPSSATITINKPNTDEDLITAQAMSVGGDGLLSYALTSGNNDTVDLNYQAVVSYVVSGTTFTSKIYYDIVEQTLPTMVIDDDIVRELPQVGEKGYRVHGTATSGSTTTIVDVEGLDRFANDYFTGGLAVNLDTDETRQITDFVSSTGTVTTSAFSGAISTNPYMLIRSYTREIEQALIKLKSKISIIGHNPEQYLDGDDLFLVHLYMAVAEVCKSFTTDSETYWWDLWKDYEKKADTLFDNCEFDYDESNDGIISGGEEGVSIRNRTIGRG